MVDPSARFRFDRKALAGFCRRKGIRELSVFGSALRDDFKPESSDVDILVEFHPERKVTMLDMAGLERQLGTVMGIKQKIDLRTAQELHPLFRGDVLRERAVLYEYVKK